MRKLVYSLWHCVVQLYRYLPLYMRLQLHHIIPELQPYVKTICSMECDGDIDTRPIRVLPDTCVELFVSYTSTAVAIIGNELHKRSIVTFRMSRPMDVQMRKGSGCLAVCFYPGTAYKFFHLPMHLLTDTTTALTDIWQGMAEEIEERLANACSNDERGVITQQYLLRLLKNGRDDIPVIYCLHQTRFSDEAVTVRQLADDIGISQRHLSRRFHQYIGLSPKEYLRAARFVRSLQYLKKYPTCSLTEIAYKSGYYDQAHFIRDYKKFAGCTPGEVAQAQNILY